MFKKEKKQEKPRPERFKRMDEHELRSWLNVSIMELGATYDVWAFHKGDPDEVTKIINLVSDMWTELQSRPK